MASRHYYNMYNHYINDLIFAVRFNNYIISVIRNDDALVFKHVMFENQCKMVYRLA